MRIENRRTGRAWVVAALAAGLIFAGEGSPDPAGRAARSFTLRDINPRSATHGQEVALADLWTKRGLALEFAASWCVPCREELPHLEQLFAKDGLPIALVAADEGPAETANILILAERVGLTMPLLYVPPERLPEVERHYTYQILPSTYLIDRSGRIEELVEGPMAKDELAAALAKLVAPARH
jgi:thiol-disulfide isomerase/thioredoxin